MPAGIAESWRYLRRSCKQLPQHPPSDTRGMCILQPGPSPASAALGQQGAGEERAKPSATAGSKSPMGTAAQPRLQAPGQDELQGHAPRWWWELVEQLVFKSHRKLGGYGRAGMKWGGTSFGERKNKTIRWGAIVAGTSQNI